MSKLKVILPIIIVLGTMLTAGVLLYQQLDPRLEQVAFQNSPDVQQSNGGGVEGAEQLSDIANVWSEPTMNDATSTTIPTETAEPLDALAQPENTTTDVNTATETQVQERTEIRATTTAANNVVVQIFKPQATITCPIALSGSVSAHTVMQQAASQCNFIYSGKDYPGLGFFVEQIDQVAQDKAQGVYWIYSINGVKATVGISGQTVEPGDTITWTYEAEY